MEKRFADVKEISEAYGMHPKAVRNICHARGKQIATKPNGGKLYINIKAFEKHLAEYYPDYLRRIRK